MKYFISSNLDPFYNLALEDKIVRNFNQDSPRLMIWRSRPSVVLGRFQNPWAEANLKYLLENDIFLVRRQSGGGCVYHDPGNVNFSFFHQGRDIPKSQNLQLLVTFLKNEGFEVYENDRFDLYLTHEGEDFKITGSAFKQTKDASFHHFTLLIETNKEMLNHSLESSLNLKETRSIASKRSNVLTLKDVNPNFSYEYFIEKFQKFLSNQDFSLDPENLKPDSQKIDEFLSWNWFIGETPKFSFENDLISFESHKGKLISLRVENQQVPIEQEVQMDFQLIKSFLVEKNIFISSNLEQFLLQNLTETSHLNRE